MTNGNIRLKSVASPNGYFASLMLCVDNDGGAYYIVATPEGGVEFDRYEDAFNAYHAEIGEPPK